MEEGLKQGGITAALGRVPWMRVALVTLTFLIASLYIWQVNLSSTRGYALRELQSTISDKQIELERLNMDVARLSSVDSVRNRVSMLGLVKPTTVSYLSGTTSVALR